MAIMWGIADIIRYAYYINKNDATTFVRYHGFLILYPLGVWAEMKVINNYIKRHAA
jgi:C4-dicarboxylate transporter